MSEGGILDPRALHMTTCRDVGLRHGVIRNNNISTAAVLVFQSHQEKMVILQVSLLEMASSSTGCGGRSGSGRAQRKVVFVAWYLDLELASHAGSSGH